MIRECKGVCVQEYVEDYTVVDLETTGRYAGVAKIIEIGAIKVRKGKVVDEFSTLINPQCHIPEEATLVNHISDDMVNDAPIISEVMEEFLEFINDDVIVGYNVAAFDLNFLYDDCLRVTNKPLKNNYIDIMHSARKCIKGLDKYSLEVISQYYQLNTEGEHRSLKDCYLTKYCYEKINEEYGDKAFQRGVSGNSKMHIKYTSETLALKELHSILEDTIEDGKVTKEEFDFIKNWTESNINLQGNYPFDRVFDAIDRVLEDGVVSADELNELQVIFEEFVDPVKRFGVHSVSGSISGKHICLTGDFEYGSRSEVGTLIESMGGIVDKTVKKSTDFVVVGACGSDYWKTGNYGSKIQKALEYNGKGSEIKIVEEGEFIPQIKTMDGFQMKLEGIQIGDEEVDWKLSIQNLLDDMIKEFELPDKSLYLKENRSRKNNDITSYSLSIYEPEFPIDKNKKTITNNQIVFNIKEKNNKLELIIGKTQFGDVQQPKRLEVKNLNSDKDNIHVTIDKNSDELIEYVKKNTEYALANYESKASSFGCCSKFNECSNAKKCVHENKLYSHACLYRKNLEDGKIFYGKNRNID